MDYDELIERLRVCPNIEHARIVSHADRVPECVVPTAVRDEAADAITTLRAEIASRDAALVKAREALQIGDKVRVIGEYEADWQGIDTWLVGINMDSEGLNYTIGEHWPVPPRFSIGYSGPTDGFREGDLVRALATQGDGA